MVAGVYAVTWTIGLSLKKSENFFPLFYDGDLSSGMYGNGPWKIKQVFLW
jgi:hypothetical protein